MARSSTKRLRLFRLTHASVVCAGALTLAGVALGCRGYQYGHIVKNGQPDLVGSHAAGAEVFNPLIDETVAKLLGRVEASGQYGLVSPDGMPIKPVICFVGVENKSAEELGDFKDQIYAQIDAKISGADSFRTISRRVVEAGLQQTRLRPDALVIPDNMALFCSVLQRDGQPVDYLLYAKLTSGTTERNKSSQRDYLLTLELINTHNADSLSEQASISKGYHASYLGKAVNYNPFKAWK